MNPSPFLHGTHVHGQSDRGLLPQNGGEPPRGIILEVPAASVTKHPVVKWGGTADDSMNSERDSA